MKKFAKIVLWLVVILAVLLGAAVMFLDRVILHGFNTAAPAVLGVDASLGDAQVKLLRGYVSLKDLHIGNPEGFKTDGLFDLGEVMVDVDMATIGSDPIVIDRVLVQGAGVTYEQGLRGNNIGALLEQLAREEEVEEVEQAEESEKPGKKIVIRQLDVEGTKLNVSLTAMMGAAVPVPLPPIHLTGIGEESGGATVLETVQAIIGGVFAAVQGAVAGAGDLLGDAAGLVGDGAKALADGAATTVGAVADGATATVGAVTDGAVAVGGAVADGASATVGAVVDGASAVGGAVAGGATAVGSAVADGASAAADGVKAVGRFLNPFDGNQADAAE